MLPRITTTSAIFQPTVISFRQAQIDEGGRAHVPAIGVGPAFAHQVEAQLALGALDAGVGLAGRRAQGPGHLGRVLALGDIAERLLQDAHALPDLADAHQVAVVGVAVEGHRHLEVKAVVDGVGLGAANVVVDARGAGHRAGDAVGAGQLRLEHAHALAAHHQDLVLGQQLLHLVHVAGHAATISLPCPASRRAGPRARRPAGHSCRSCASRRPSQTGPGSSRGPQSSTSGA